MDDAPSARLPNVGHLSQPIPEGATQWRQERGDSQRRGYAYWPASELSQPEVLWQAELGPMWSPLSPVVARDGTIYLARATAPESSDLDDALMAFNPDGTLRWQTSLHDELPLIVDTYCRPPLPQTLVWGNVLRATPAVRRDGHLVVLREVLAPRCTDGQVDGWVDLGVVFLINPSGQVVGGPHVIGPGLSAPALDDDDNAYIVVRAEDGLAVLERFDSAFDRRQMSWWRPDAPSVLPDVGEALWDAAQAWTDFLCGDSLLRNIAACFDHGGLGGGSFDPTRPRTSLLLPSAALSPQCADAVVTGPATVRGWPAAGPLWWKGISARTSPAMGAGGRVYLLAWDDGDGLEAWDQDGHRAWRVEFGHPVAVPPAIGRGSDGGDSVVACERRAVDGTSVTVRDHRADDELYVAMADGFLYAFDARGRQRWRVPVGNGVFSAPVVIELQNGEQQIVVANENALWAWSRDGAPLWFVRLDSPARGSPAVANGRIYLATETSLVAIGLRPRALVAVPPPEPEPSDDPAAPTPTAIPTATRTATATPSPTPTSTPQTRVIADPVRLVPDLVVDGVTVRVSDSAGASDCDPGLNNVTVVIKNDGGADAGAFQVRLRVDGRDPGDDEQTIAGLDAGQEATATFSSVLLQQGTHTIQVTVDTEHKVAERDETNNVLTARVNCQPKVT